MFIKKFEIGDWIILIFIYMDIEEFLDCGKDYIWVLNGDDFNVLEVGIYCGRMILIFIMLLGFVLMI